MMRLLSSHLLPGASILSIIKKILISDTALDLDDLNGLIQNNAGESGAAVIFTGAVRVSAEEQGLTGMTLEHYPGMTESQLEIIIKKAQAKWHLTRVMVAHRVGYLTPGEPIVFVGVASLHRKEAFLAAEFIMDYLKQDATFWKKEHYADQSHWVEAKESDREAVSQWDRV